MSWVFNLLHASVFISLSVLMWILTRSRDDIFGEVRVIAYSLYFILALEGLDKIIYPLHQRNFVDLLIMIFGASCLVLTVRNFEKLTQFPSHKDVVKLKSDKSNLRLEIQYYKSQIALLKLGEKDPQENDKRKRNMGDGSGGSQ